MSPGKPEVDSGSEPYSFIEDADATAQEMRQGLTHSLSLLQASIGSPDSANSLLPVALREVDRIDQEIAQLLTDLSSARVTFANHSTLKTSLTKLTKQLSDTVDANSSRLFDLLSSCHGSSNRTARLSGGRLQLSAERLAIELMGLDELDWLDSTDVLIQELKVSVLRIPFTEILIFSLQKVE